MVQFRFFESSTDIRSDDPAERIQRRFINYLISFPFARAEHENEDGAVDEALKESAEEAKRRRMLEVERLRHQERQRKAQSQQRFQDRISEELHEDIYDRILTTIEDADELKQSIIVMPETLPE